MSMYHYSSEETRLCDICWDYKPRQDVILLDFGDYSTIPMRYSKDRGFSRLRWYCKDCYRECIEWSYVYVCGCSE